MNKPFFSIIIPTYNRADFLEIAIESVLQQTYDNYELIIIDDGSSDITQEMIRTHTASSHIRYFYQDNKGPAAARNRGIEKARGEYISFLDSDDRLLSNKLEITAKAIQQFPDYKAFHTEEIWYRNGKLLPHKKHHHKPDGDVFSNALVLCCISPSTACIHREIFKIIGTFDETMPVCEDYDFWLRVTSQYPVKLIKKQLTIKEGGKPDQQSKRYEAIDTYRMYAIEKLIESGMLDKEKRKMAIDEYNRKCLIYLKGATKRNKQQEIKMYEEKLKKLKNSC